jgi:hypothetical protein
VGPWPQGIETALISGDNKAVADVRLVDVVAVNAVMLRRAENKFLVAPQGAVLARA